MSVEKTWPPSTAIFANGSGSPSITRRRHSIERLNFESYDKFFLSFFYVVFHSFFFCSFHDDDRVKELFSKYLIFCMCSMSNFRMKTKIEFLFNNISLMPVRCVCHTSDKIEWERNSLIFLLLSMNTQRKNMKKIPCLFIAAKRHSRLSPSEKKEYKKSNRRDSKFYHEFI